MLGKPHWFKRRKYGGWGFYPCCWQGWTYLGLIILPIFLVQYLPFLGSDGRLVATFVWGAVIMADSIHIMVQMPMDEREKRHEAMAERNALWAIILALCFGVAYQTAAGAAKGTVAVDPVIIVALFAGVVIKAATNIYLDRRD